MAKRVAIDAARCSWVPLDATSLIQRLQGEGRRGRPRWRPRRWMCAICAGAGEGVRARHHLTHGVSAWLCGVHRSVEFQRRRGGRDFVASLAAVWGAAGTMTRRHDHALRRHLARVRPRNDPRDLPGSYAWAGLRRSAGLPPVRNPKWSLGSSSRHPYRRCEPADLPHLAPLVHRRTVAPGATRATPAGGRPPHGTAAARRGAWASSSC